MSVRSNEDENLPMSGSLVKILYILHWLVIDAAAECSELVSHLVYLISTLLQITYSLPEHKWRR